MTVNKIRVGRVVDLVTETAGNSDFQLGLESVESHTGKLIGDEHSSFSGPGVEFLPGDVLFGKLRPYLAKSWLADRKGSAVGEFHVYRPHFDVLDPVFLKYFTLSSEFIEHVTSSMYGVKMPRASWNFVRNIEIDCPRVDKQRAIADYLDRETQKIDELISEQRGLIETLTERRRSFRTEVALHGIDCEITRRTSIPWAPSIPESWKTVPLSIVAKIESGHTPSRSRSEWWTNAYIPWISLHDVSRMRTMKYLESTVYQVSDAGIANSSARVLPAGTVVLSRDATVGRTVIMKVPMATSQHFGAWICGPLLNPEYLWALFSDAMQPHFESFRNGATLRTIGMSDLKSFRIPLPPVEEQVRIVTYLDEQTSRIDELISESENLIALSHERRSALITAAVTGQIDVRNAS